MAATRPRRVDRQKTAPQAEELVARLFREAGWTVRRARSRLEDPSADFMVELKGTVYVVEVKAASEGRTDRLIPLWSQAWVQARASARGDQQPLAVVVAPRLSRGMADQVLEFATRYAPEAAVGVVDFTGLRAFRGESLDPLNREGPRAPAIASRRVPPEPINLFSDLNQWMLKVLLAPELSEDMLSAPRGRYRNASQLAHAAVVSVMSASRFLRQLEQDGFLHESSRYLELVRRGDLFERWRAWAGRRMQETGYRFLLATEPSKRPGAAAKATGGCLGLFAAADSLGVGFVHGVPPHVYVHRQEIASRTSWKNLVPAEPGENTDLMIRAATAPNSVFRGAVIRESVPVCDVLQVWLDVSTHPARGREQAELIRQKILAAVIE